MWTTDALKSTMVLQQTHSLTGRHRPLVPIRVPIHSLSSSDLGICLRVPILTWTSSSPCLHPRPDFPHAHPRGTFPEHARTHTRNLTCASPTPTYVYTHLKLCIALVSPSCHACIRIFSSLWHPGAIGISAGGRHSMVLKQDGCVWITGDNEYGQIGDLTFVNKKSFLQVSRKGPCGDVVYRLVCRQLTLLP